MNKRDYYSKLLTSFSDPTMIANAFENYFRRIYERTINKVGSIINSDTNNLTNSNQSDYIALTIKDRNYVFNTNDLKAQLSVITDLNSEINISNKITLVDQNTKETVELLISDVSQAIGDCVDNAYVTWQGFKSLVDNEVESANNFLTNVSIKMSSAYGSLKDSVLNIFNTLHNSDMSIMDKLDYLCEFTGLKQATEDPNNIEQADIELASYTGVNPVIGWLSGIDWSGIVIDVLSIPLLVQKFVNKCMVTVMKGVVGLFSKTFSWIGNWFKKTFVNPVDYKCDDSTLEFFKIPAKFCYALNPQATGSTAHDKEIIQWFADFGFDSELWLNDARVYRKITIDVTQDKPYILEERYISPISPEKLFGVLSQFISPSDWVPQTTSTGTYNSFNGLRTINDLLNLFSALNSADLSINSQVPEKDVYVGLLLSLYLNEQIDDERQSLYNIYKNNVSDLLREQPLNFQKYSNENYGNLYAVLYEYINGRSFDDQRRSILLGTTTYFADNLAGNTITNANFIERLTWNSAFYVVNGEVKSDVNQISTYAKFSGSYLNVWDPDLIQGNNSGMSMTFNGRLYVVFPWWLNSILVLLHSRVIHNGDEYDGAFVPYLNHAPKFNRNIDIVTDQEHQEAITNFVKGAAITAATIAAAVVGGIVISKTFHKFRQLALSAETMGFNYGQAIQNGNIEEANRLYNQYYSNSLKARLLGLCLGKSSDLAGSSIDGLNIVLNGSNANSQILAVIVPKKHK